MSSPTVLRRPRLDEADSASQAAAAPPTAMIPPFSPSTFSGRDAACCTELAVGPGDDVLRAVRGRLRQARPAGHRRLEDRVLRDVERRGLTEVVEDRAERASPKAPSLQHERRRPRRTEAMMTRSWPRATSRRCSRAGMTRWLAQARLSRGAVLLTADQVVGAPSRTDPGDLNRAASSAAGAHRVRSVRRIVDENGGRRRFHRTGSKRNEPRCVRSS